MEIKFSAGLTERRSPFPTSEPIKVKRMAKGWRRFYFEEGTLEVPPEPGYNLVYGSWIAENGEARDWYEVPVGLTGSMFGDGLYFEAWNYKIDARRHYRFDKVLKLVNLWTQEVISAEFLCKFLGGRMIHPLFNEFHGVNRTAVTG
jgi:hypothetical protein